MIRLTIAFALMLTTNIILVAQNLKPVVKTVASFKGQQVTGISLSTNGRMFVNFPRWRSTVINSVAEINAKGEARPYPDKQWNSWTPGKPVADSAFVAVQSVLVYNNKLYVLDTRNPLWKGVVDAPRIFIFNLQNNKLEDILVLSAGSYKADSYTNDLRMDPQHQTIYITDSNAPALIVYNLKTRKSRRVLDSHFSTTAEGSQLTIDGKPWGNKPTHADGIALNPINNRLYYHALTGHTLYAIPATILSSASESGIEASVKKEGITPAPDGMVFDHKGNLYMGDLEHHKIVMLSSSGKIKTLVEGEKADWPDTFSIYNGYLYYTNSRINEAKGDVANLVFTVNKVKINQ